MMSQDAQTLDIMFGTEYRKRIVNLLRKSFPKDIYDMVNISHRDQVLIVNYIFSDRNTGLFPMCLFGDVVFAKDKEIHFRKYDDFDDKSNLKIRVIARVIHDKENFFERDYKRENLNAQFERIEKKIGRSLELYSTLDDRDASYFVKELNNYFANDILTLYKVVTEDEVNFYKITSLLNKNEICFLSPFKTDKMFQSSLKVFFQEEYKICVNDLNDSNVSEYLEMIKTINY